MRTVPMEVRCIGEPLLRSSGKPIQSFLAPSLITAWQLRSSMSFSHQNCLRNQRDFSSSVSCRAESPTPRAASEKPSKPIDPKERLKSIFDRTRASKPPSPLPSTIPERTDMKPRINAKLDELFPTKDSSHSPSSSTVSEVANAYRSFLDRSRTGLKQGSIAGSMIMPGTNDGSTVDQRQANASLRAEQSGPPARRSKRTIRSRPTVGRTIEVEEKRGVDFGQAMARLKVLVHLNRIKSDQYAQKYHERPGLKRKRLKSLRWRRYFKEGFVTTVDRVKQMRRQGW